MAPDMKYFCVRNFEKFQHYKTRKPIWIKLYFDILQDREFWRLQDASKWLAIGLFLLASQHDNKIPVDPPWIKHMLGLDKDPDLQTLLDAGFILPIDCDASELLADCYNRVEKSREEESIKSVVQTTPFHSFSGQKPETKAARETRKARILEAAFVFKFWNAQPGTMHHRAINSHEKEIISALKHYEREEICRAIARYGIVKSNGNGKYRDVYSWTLSEFLRLESHKNLERFNAENWEEPFLNRNFVNGPSQQESTSERLERIVGGKDEESGD